MKDGESKKFKTLKELAEAILQLPEKQQNGKVVYREPYDEGEIRLLDSMFVLDEDEEEINFEQPIKKGSVVLW